MPVSSIDPDDGQDDGVHTPLLKKASRHTDSLSQKVSLLFQDWFMWELLSAVLALLSLVAIVCVLAAYDSSSLPDWPSVITVGFSLLSPVIQTSTESLQINTIISFFATIGKLSLTSTLGACISQSKWLWYKRNPRPLQNLQVFDNASRGPWGALALLLAVKARYKVHLRRCCRVLTPALGVKPPLVLQS